MYDAPADLTPNMRRHGKTGPFRGLWKHLELQTRLTIAFSGSQV
jgi:hypothetical protein